MAKEKLKNYAVMSFDLVSDVTEKAIFVNNNWFPKSQVGFICQNATYIMFAVPTWLAKDKNLGYHGVTEMNPSRLVLPQTLENWENEIRTQLGFEALEV